MGSSQGSTLSADVMSLVDTLPVLAKTLIAGGAAGAVAKTAVAPLERIKILLQTRTNDFRTLGVSQSLKKVLQCDGPLGFYKGNGASVIRIIPYAALHYMTYELYRDWILEKNLPLGSGPIVDLVAGSAAGGTAVLCTYPLDLARTKLAYQVFDTRQSLGGGANGFYRQPTYSGIKQVLAMAYKEGGPRGLYRGIGPTLIGILPYAGLKFYIYEELKRHVPEEHQNSVRMHLPCGALAGLFGQTITYPLDVVRRQMQVENLQPMTSEGHNKRYKNTFDGLNTIVRTQGWRQLFAGLSINYIKIVPSVAIGFTVYESMKSWMRINQKKVEVFFFGVLVLSMEGMLSSSDQQRLVSSFLEIAVGQTAETARQFLQATSWKLEEAIQLFYIGNEGGMLPSGTHTQPESNDHVAAQSWGAGTDAGNERILQNDVDEVRAPLPVVRETLYGDSMYYGAMRVGSSQPEPSSLIAFRNFSEEPKSPGIWEPDEGASSASASASASESASAPRDSLASLYRPPFHLMFHGSFEQAKTTSSTQGKWLLVNLQSTTEFSSHMLNRDTWANEAVSQTIKANFIFWQVYDDTTEGRKVCTYYKLESIPVVLVIDPTTGQKMRMWCGMVEPETLLEDLVPFMDGGPREHFVSLSKKRPRGSFSLNPHSKPKEDVAKDEDEEELQRALAASLEDNNMKESSDDQSTITPEEVTVETVTTAMLPTFPPLPEEPKGGDRNVQCRVGIRLPNGRRLQRNFLKTDTIQLLWSFCYSQLEESERKKPLKLTQAIPGESKTLEYESNLTLEQSGVANSMISATWE